MVTGELFNCLTWILIYYSEQQIHPMLFSAWEMPLHLQPYHCILQSSVSLSHGNWVTPVEERAPPHWCFTHYNQPSATLESSSVWALCSSSFLLLCPHLKWYPSWTPLDSPHFPVFIKFFPPPQILVLLLHFLNQWITSLISVQITSSQMKSDTS